MCHLWPAADSPAQNPFRVPAKRAPSGSEAEAGRCGEAIEEYREAIRIQPNHLSAHFNLAVALGEGAPVEELAPDAALGRLIRIRFSARGRVQ